MKVSNTYQKRSEIKVAELEKIPKMNTTKQNYHDLNGQVVKFSYSRAKSKSGKTKRIFLCHVPLKWASFFLEVGCDHT